MLPFLYMGAASGIGLLLGKKLFPRKPRSNPKKKPNTLSIQTLGHTLVDEKNLVLATEEIPLDNRFGSKPLESEHEFAHTATISLQIGRTGKTSVGFKSSLLKALESRTEGEINKSLGIEVGSRISRRVRLKFATDPGKCVRYRVVWSQQSRRGVFDVQIGKRIVGIPYMVAYGLSHAVESINVLEEVEEDSMP